MTVLTVSTSADAGSSLRPVPWRRLLWVVWRQHRPTFISVAAVLGAAVVYLIVVGQKIHRDFAALTACHPATSGVCAALANSFTGVDWRLSNGTLIAVNLAPALLGAFAGAPLLARDLETGAFRYLWTQGAGRVRSTIARLVLVGLLVTVLAGVTGQVFAWFFQPALENSGDSGMTVLTETVFHSRGFAFPAWTLATFALGAFCGMLLRRILPAMAVTLAAYAVLYILTWQFLAPRYPVSLVTSNPHLINAADAPLTSAAGSVPANTLNTSPWILSGWKTGSTQWWRYIPVTRFWPMQLIEAGWLVVFAIALFAGTVWLARLRAA